MPWALYMLIFVAIYRNQSRPSRRSEGCTQVIPSSPGVRRDVFAVTRLTAILVAASCFVSSRISFLYTVGFRSCMQQQYHIAYQVIPFHTAFMVIYISSWFLRLDPFKVAFPKYRGWLLNLFFEPLRNLLPI